jgi:hypothetical protein
MTPYKIMEIALANVGLPISNSQFKTRAREYLDIEAGDLVSRTRWLWRYKATTLTTSNGIRAYSLASDVLEPLAFRDQTNNQPLEMTTTRIPDGLDPNADETGQPRVVVLTGINASTGYWTVDIFPTPTATLTVAYRYFSTWAALATNGNDDTTDLAPKIPIWVQPALIHGVTARYLNEKGNYALAAQEEGKKERVIQQPLDRNIKAQGDARARMQRSGDTGPGAVDFEVREGSLT